MKIGYITNTSRYSGVGMRAWAIAERLKRIEGTQLMHLGLDGERGILEEQGRPVEQVRSRPHIMPKSVNWVRLGRKLRSHLKYSVEPPCDVFDVTNQTLAFLAGRLPAPTIVTVHDLIELIDPQDNWAALLNRYLYSGIPRADHIIAVSQYAKKTIQERYGVGDETVSVINNGVDTAVFYPIDDFQHTLGYQEVRRELKVEDSHPIVLYVGSDHPRKNLPVALAAFAKLRQERPDAVFIKVGEPGLPIGREATLSAADALHIRGAVRFIGTVTDERLNELYNLAQVFIFPSRFEGFGLPPLQAMAAGLPVVCSNATSLPEVVGSAALTHDPDDVEGLAESLKRVTSDKAEAERLRAAGLERAKTFSWDAATMQVFEVYKNLQS